MPDPSGPRPIRLWARSRTPAAGESARTRTCRGSGKRLPSARSPGNGPCRAKAPSPAAACRATSACVSASGTWPSRSRPRFSTLPAVRSAWNVSPFGPAAPNACTRRDVLPAVRAGGDGVALGHPRQPRLDRRDRPRQLLVDDRPGGRRRAGRRRVHRVLQRREEPLGGGRRRDRAQRRRRRRREAGGGHLPPRLAVAPVDGRAVRQDLVARLVAAGLDPGDPLRPGAQHAHQRGDPGGVPAAEVDVPRQPQAGVVVDHPPLLPRRAGAVRRGAAPLDRGDVEDAGAERPRQPRRQVRPDRLAGVRPAPAGAERQEQHEPRDRPRHGQTPPVNLRDRKTVSTTAFMMSMKNAPTIGTMTKACGAGP